MQLIIAQFRSTTKNSIQTLLVAYNKMNCTNISVSNAKKIEFKRNLLFYNIYMQHVNQKSVAWENDILDSSSN